MGFLDSLKSMFTGPPTSKEHWVYVRCQRCGEVIKTRIDLHNDLSPQEQSGYLVRKTMVGDQLCFARIEVTLYFDARRQLVNQEITGGQFISPEAYAADQSHPAQ